MTTETFLPTIDTYIRAAMPDANFANSSLMLVQNPWQAAGLIKFDLSSIPANAICTSATLYTTSATADGATTTDVFQIAAAKADADFSQATWNAYKYGELWTGAGAFHAGDDYTPTLLGQFVTADWEVGVEKSCVLDAATIQTWFGSNEFNYGLKLVNTVGSSAHFASITHWETDWRPYLEIVYTVGPPEAAEADAFAQEPVEGLGDVSVTPPTADAEAFADAPTVLQASVPPKPLNYSGNIYLTTRQQRINVLLLTTNGSDWVPTDSAGNRVTMGVLLTRREANLVPQ